jgi:hypothetical protein
MRLIYTSGSREGQAVDFDGARLTIGREHDNDISVADDRVSRRHAVIELDQDGRIVLRDLNSRNGTYVDGVRLAEPRVLAGGEQLRFGPEQLVVEREPQPQLSPPSPPSPPPPSAPPSPPRPPARRLPAWARSRGFRVAAGAALLIVLVVVAAQIFLPGIAKSSLRSDLEKHGPVRHLSLSSSPAIKLLWKRADSVDVAMDSYRSEPGGHTSVANFLSDTRRVGKLDVSIGLLKAQLVTLHDVRLHKDGNDLAGSARITQREVTDALPNFVGIRPLSAGQNGIVLRASATVLGQRVRIRLRILADQGRVVVRPEGLPFGSLATITVFKDSRVYVKSLGARLRGNQYTLTATAALK